MVSKGWRGLLGYRIHKDGYIQARELVITIPATVYRNAISTSSYLYKGIEMAVGEYLGVKLSGVERVRVLKNFDDTVTIKLDCDWIQPTRA